MKKKFLVYNNLLSNMNNNTNARQWTRCKRR